VSLEILQTIITILGTLLGVVSGALISHLLEKDRSKRFLLLNKKIEIYSNLLVKLNTVFQDGDSNLLSDPRHQDKILTLMARPLSEARLVANKELELKLRHYYEEAVLFWTDKSDGSAMNPLVIEIEQLMREEIGQRKLH